jgi:Domain of unknown function (DUF6597)
MYQEFRPDRRLAPLVECGWARSGSPTRTLRVMPDGCVDLFVSSSGDVMIAGPATTFYDLRADNQSIFAGLRLRPGTAAAVVGLQPPFDHWPRGGGRGSFTVTPDNVITFKPRGMFRR